MEPNEWTVVIEACSLLPRMYGCELGGSVCVCSFVEDSDSITFGPAVRLEMSELLDSTSQENYEATLDLIAWRLEELGCTRTVCVAFSGHASAQHTTQIARTLGRLVHSHAQKLGLLGVFVVGQLEILGVSPGGALLGRCDVLEINRALSGQIQAFPLPSFESFAFPREPESTPTAHTRWNAGVLCTGDERAAMNAVLRFRSGHTLSESERFSVSQCLRDAAFRDGFVAWVLQGGFGRGCERSESDLSTARGVCREQSSLPVMREISASQIEWCFRLLATLVRKLPWGAGAPELSIAAYLAWRSGNSLRARILAQQAEEEDPTYEIGCLVRHAVAMCLPPPAEGWEYPSPRGSSVHH